MMAGEAHTAAEGLPVSADAIVNVVIGIAVVALLIVRQLRPRPASERSALRLTLVLGVIGILQIRSAVGGHAISAATIMLVAAGLLAGALLGVVRATTVKVWRASDGLPWRQGTLVTAVLWLISLGVHLGIDVAVDHSTTAHTLGAASILLYLAVTLGVQQEIVRARASGLPSLVKVW